MTHEDKRRRLTSIPYKDGEIKIIVAKQDCDLGNHYHKVKTEDFTLIEGEAHMTVDNHDMVMYPNKKFTVYPHEKHSIRLKKDSILFCICSHPYDKNDDYGI